ncbi:hypothetical protein ACL58G_23265 [Massilia sp. GER05]
MLQAAPELAVTADGQIAVRGNTQVTVLVDVARRVYVGLVKRFSR